MAEVWSAEVPKPNILTYNTPIEIKFLEPQLEVMLMLQIQDAYSGKDLGFDMTKPVKLLVDLENIEVWQDNMMLKRGVLRWLARSKS